MAAIHLTVACQIVKSPVFVRGDDPVIVLCAELNPMRVDTIRGPAGQTGWPQRARS